MVLRTPAALPMKSTQSFSAAAIATKVRKTQSYIEKEGKRESGREKEGESEKRERDRGR